MEAGHNPPRKPPEMGFYMEINHVKPYFPWAQNVCHKINEMSVYLNVSLQVLDKN